MTDILAQLHMDTPLAEAIFELTDGLEELLTEKLEGIPPGSVKAYIFGGCAIHLYTNVRGSNDLDVALDAAKILDVDSFIIELDPVYFDDPERGPSTLDWDTSFNVGIPSLGPDYKENAYLLNGGDNILHVYVVSAVDVAVSKLSRLAADDMNDIKALYERGYFTLDNFRGVAQDAVDYSATEESLQRNVDYAIRELQSINLTRS